MSTSPLRILCESNTRGALQRTVLATLAAAALAACGGGGGGGGGEPEAPANQAPTVSITAPTAGTSVIWGQSIIITANAADTDGTIARVEFYDGTTKIGEDTSAPYSFTWTTAAPGPHTITARAIDNSGASTTSADRALTVSNEAPTVSVTAPAAGTAISTGQTVKITATAADTEGLVTRVEFYDGTTKLGEDTTAPYEYTWVNPPAGTRNITARAFDAAGASTTSAVRTLVVASTEASWASLPTALQGGITTAPNQAVEAGGIDAIEVLTALGVHRVSPIWRAAMAQAAENMASVNFTPAGNFVNCAGGGRMLATQASATKRLVSFDNCVIGGFTIYGGVNVPAYPHTGGTPAATIQVGSTIDWDATANGFTLTISGVRITGNGAPDAGTDIYPRNALLGTTVTCTGSGATLSCLTTFATGYNWGNDLNWDNYATGPLVLPSAGALYATDDAYRLNGSFRSGFGGAAGARNIRFEDFTNNSGRAIVYGNNGWSVVTRLAPLSPGVEQLQVKRFLTSAVTVGGITYPAGAGPTETYRCEVAATGDWSCPLVVAP